MACLSTSKRSGTSRIVWLMNKKQMVVRLGKVDAKTGAAVKMHIERLIVAFVHHTPPTTDTIVWLNKIGDKLHEKIARTGICAPRQPPDSGTIGNAFDAFIESRRAFSKPNTILIWGQARRHLCGFLGEKRKLASVTPADADDFKRQMRGRYSEATTAKAILNAKAVFRYAVRRRLLDVSPFADVKNGSQRNPDRQAFVDQATIQKVIDAAPDTRWRLIIALARFGGLRVPSELSALTWDDINWDAGRITIRSAKTEHHTGHGTRVMPLFPELLPHLREAFESAEPGEVHVVPMPRWSPPNLRSYLLKIIAKAGVMPWPKLFQNLRASRATELCDHFPSHVAAAWLGHAEGIAKRHYRQVTDEHFSKAIGTTPAPADGQVRSAFSGNASENRDARGGIDTQSDEASNTRPASLQPVATSFDSPHIGGVGDDGCGVVAAGKGNVCPRLEN